MHQAPGTVLMIRPANFGYNPETSASNVFQTKGKDASEIIRDRAIQEFDALVEKLRTYKTQVIVMDDTPEPVKPDAVFPNNWISTHHDGTVIMYPMMAPSRRLEKRDDVLSILQVKSGFDIRYVHDLSAYEENSRFLEGTGSIVFDYEHKKAYANLSPRTNMEVLERICDILNFEPVVFSAKDREGKDIYHTNVLMCVGNRFAVICFECIPDPNERRMLKQSLENTGHEIFEITWDQLRAFAGNMIQLKNRDGQNILVMSDSAFNALTESQKKGLGRYGELVHTDLETIEKYGGGSARCMIAGIFLPKIQVMK